MSILLLAGCTPYSKGPVDGAFHDLTAHYNAYFLAKERIKEIEAALYDQQVWNYDKILPIYPEFDTTLATSFKTELEDCIQKASIAIQRHPESKWEDDSYIVVGKARHYGSEFPDAVETFKYVNTHSEDDDARHHALAQLLLSFTTFKEYKNAQAVVDYLSRETLSKENQKRFFLNAAYLYQQTNVLEKMAPFLAKAEALYHAPDKARINFIIGQVYDRLQQETEAYKYYKKVLKHNPSYELSFYARLYMSKVRKLNEDSDLKKIRKYFAKLLKDTKNKEYKDKIYFELANFELNKGYLDEAIQNFKLSVRSSEKNTRQKAYAYLSLGQIYHDTLKKYALAKKYYDSTVSVMPQEEEVFEAVKKRQEILVDFVAHITVLQKNDSLLHLASLPQDSLFQAAVEMLTKEREIKKEKARKERRRAIERAEVVSKEQGENIIATTSISSKWYFNNPNQVAKGANDFIKKWGDRALEDNWRRASKKESSTRSSELEVATTKVATTAPEEDEIPVEDEAKTWMKPIPKTAEAKQKLLAEVEQALYNLGNIYHLRLAENKNAIRSFETLLDRFSQTQYRAELLYQLFLLYKTSDLSRSAQYGDQLKKEFPKTVYAKLVDNPYYREETFAITGQLKTRYRQLYRAYQNGDYLLVRQAVDSALRLHPENEFSDNMALLGILAVGQLSNERKYQYELSQFAKNYPESELLAYVGTLAETSQTFQQKRYNSGKARFIKSFNQKHFFVAVYPNKGLLADQVPKEITTYLESKNFKNLKTANLILGDQYAMVFIDSFPGRGTAQNFFSEYQSEVNLSEQLNEKKISIFVITDDNFNILFQTKDVDSYLTFFQKNYL